MPIITIVVGALLDIVGTTGWLATGRQSWTALIPSILGTLMIVCGVIAFAKPALRKHVMHAAATLGLLGFLGTLKGLFQLPGLLSGAEIARPPAVIAQSITSILCLIFLALCVNSFIAARRSQAAAKSALDSGNT
jgi:hypothetical protein